MTGYFIFDDIDTRDFEDISVYFDNVDKTPKRMYEVIDIPARNGSFYIDENRYEDVEHIYHIVALTKEAGSAIINALSSKVGYYRLEDSFNPDEFYRAVFTSGAEPKIVSTRDKNTFKVTFTRKPQRFLKSGETEVTVSSGGTINNPTLYDSSPLVEVEGYGSLSFNGHTITIENSVMGELLLANSQTYSSNYQELIFSKLSYNTGDTITLEDGLIEWNMSTKSGYYFWDAPVVTADSNSAFSTSGSYGGIRKINAFTNRTAITFTAGTSKTVTNTATATFPIGQTYDARSNITATCTQTITYTPDYSSTQSKISVQYALSYSSSGKLDYSFYGASSRTGDVIVNSTQSLLGHPTYIDCDLGEAYKGAPGSYVSLNSKISIGSKLPTLTSGSNTITYSDTMTSVKFVPRWWRL